MHFSNISQQYWPFLALVLWITFKWPNSQRVVAMLPELKRDGAMLVDVRSAGEFAGGTRNGIAKLLLIKNGYKKVHNIGTWGKFLDKS